MAYPTEMIGEIEIVAVCKVLRRPIHVFVGRSVLGSSNKNEIGEYVGPPLFAKYINLGDDVGHYECILPISLSERPTMTNFVTQR